jgi:hypothetical protein
MERAPYRDDVTDTLPHGNLWSQGLRLAEAEIGRGPVPAGRWSRRFGAAGGWSPEAAPADFGAEEENLSAQAA